MAVRLRSEEEGDECDDEDDIEVECDVCVGSEADRIEAEKERNVQRMGDPGGRRRWKSRTIIGPTFRIGIGVLIVSKGRGRT